MSEAVLIRVWPPIVMRVLHLWFRVCCCAVDRVPEGMEWAYSTGFVNEDMVREHLFPAGPETAALLCGPPPMIKFACVPNLEKLGYKAEDCICF